jgi:hypothetical protein
MCFSKPPFFVGCPHRDGVPLLCSPVVPVWAFFCPHKSNEIGSLSVAALFCFSSNNYQQRYLNGQSGLSPFTCGDSDPHHMDLMVSSPLPRSGAGKSPLFSASTR